MPFSNTAGLGVNNHYGPRDSGGVKGVFKTVGYESEFVWDLSKTGLPVKFPTNVEVTGVDLTFVTGTVTALTIGGVAVLAASLAAPVGVVTANTGVLVKTGGTAGTIVIRFKVAPAGITVA
jgi:hypothetical protein